MPRVAGITDKQRAFVREYLVDGNAVQAAIRAGYSKGRSGNTASQLMGKRWILDAIRDATEAKRASADIEARRVLEEYARIGFSNISDYLSFGPDGVTVNDSREIPRELLAAVSEVSETRTQHGSTIKFKMHNKTAALDAICRVLGFNASDRKDNPADSTEIARQLLDLLRLAGPNR